MSNRKDQGRYARMVAFWGILLLVCYGCFRGGGLVDVMGGWMGDSNQTYIDPFPIVGTLSTATLICFGVVALVAFLVHRFLSVPKVADTLVETEGEMYKVTWPGWPETWNGTVAVAIMVVILLLFLAAVDLVLAGAMKAFFSGGGEGAS